MPRVRVLNGSFDAITIAEAVDVVAAMIGPARAVGARSNLAS